MSESGRFVIALPHPRGRPVAVSLEVAPGICLREQGYPVHEDERGRRVRLESREQVVFVLVANRADARRLRVVRGAPSSTLQRRVGIEVVSVDVRRGALAPGEEKEVRV